MTPSKMTQLFHDLQPHVESPERTAQRIADMVALGDNEERSQFHAQGYWVLGQFLTHNIVDETSDIGTHASRTRNNLSTATLDGMYGGDPKARPDLYDKETPGCFLMGEKFTDPDTGRTYYDIQRNKQGRAIAGDRRQENTLLAQLHAMFQAMHNKLVKEHGKTFAEARRITEWTFQWLVINDYMDRFADNRFNQFLTGDRRNSRLPECFGVCPLELSGAILRFGHAQVPSLVTLNDSQRDIPVLQGAFSPAETFVDWDFLFPNPKSPHVCPKALRIRPAISPAMAMMVSEPPGKQNISQRNLERGASYGLPGFDAVAKRLELDHETIQTDAPLWIGVLQEADQHEAYNDNLGPVGSTILTGCFRSFFEHEPTSYWTVHRSWVPADEPELIGMGEDPKMADLVAWIRGESNGGVV